MDWKQFLRTWQGTRKENQIARWSVPLLAATTTLLAAHILTSGETVVIEPAAPLEKSVAISASSASPEYQQAWGYQVALMLGNVYPGNAEATLKMLDLVLTAATYPTVREEISRQVRDLRDAGASVSFLPEVVDYRDRDGVVIVTGTQKVTPRRGEPRDRVWTYEIKIGMVRFRPQLISVTTYRGTPEEKEEREEQEDQS